jgi:hypothetical protein
LPRSAVPRIGDKLLRCIILCGRESGVGQSRRINDTAGMSARLQIAAVSLRCSELALRATSGLPRRSGWRLVIEVELPLRERRQAL